MESLLKPVTENGDTSATRSPRRSVDVSPSLDSVLDEIRAGAENALYGAGSIESEELFAKHVVSLVEGAGLPVLQTMHYRWFLRELARLWRTRQGRDLAFHLELCIRKWVGLGLEPKTLQFLVCEAHERLKASRPPTAHGLPPAAESVESAKSADVLSETTPSATSASSAGLRSGTTQSAESAKSADVLSETTPSATSASSAVVPSDTTPSATSASSAVLRSGTTPSASSAKSVDVRPLETAKDAKSAKPAEGSDPSTRILESSSPGILPDESSTPGPLL